MKTESTPLENESSLLLWSVSQIIFASFIAGPLGGCYFLGRNYKTCGRIDLSKKCYYAGVISSIVLFVAMFLAVLKGATSNTLVSMIPAMITGCTVAFASQQKKWTKEKFPHLGKRHSYFKCFLVAFSFLAIQILLIFSLSWFYFISR